MRSFVALDLELTPTQGDQDRIIEIAAVRFRDGEVADTFETLVNPRCALDLRIKALTGIRSSQVKSAPTLDQIAHGFVRFLSDHPIVGQSVHLDVESLQRSGIRLDNPTLDTFELGSILLPGLPSYDLAAIGRALGVQPEREHRALGDALVTGRVFLALLERAEALGLDVLTHINSLSARIPDWSLASIFADALRERLRTGLQSRPSAPSPFTRRGDGDNLETAGDQELPFLSTRPRSRLGEIRPSTPSTAPVDPVELAALMREGGRIATALQDYEERPEQIRMMEAVTRAFNEDSHLLVEAGTGTGKSLAYLLPAIYYSARNGRHVVVSTNTLNLQDQLYNKDLPALQGLLPLEFKAAVVKGRANYVCLRRWQVLSRSPNLTRDEALLLIKTLVWLSGTETGDKAELNLSTTDSALWSRISANAESCALSRCPQFRRGNCFVVRARKGAESAHVIVVNHALLLSDLASGGVLPEYSQLVIDEAHHLEEEATGQLGFTLEYGDLSSFLASLRQMGAGYRPVGFLTDLADSIRMAKLSADVNTKLLKAISSAEAAVDSVETEARPFFEAVAHFLHDHCEDRRSSGAKMRLTSSIRTQPGWSEIEMRWSELQARLVSLDRQLGRLQSELESLEDGILQERDGLAADTVGFRSFILQLAAKGGEIVSEPSRNGIYWIASGSGPDAISLCSAPLHVGEALNTLLFSAKDSVVLTSATLTAESSFDYIRERLSIEKATELVLGSPFDYQRSTLLYVAQDMPEPSRPNYQRAVEAAVADLVSALQGRTLVLFTSHAQLRLTNGAIRSMLEEQGIVVLAHGLDGSRRRLLQAFKGTERAVLLGTSSFWEGIDVVGDALSCVVIVKLPFAVPTDPIIAARSESFDDPFRQYSVPQTILKFKQGFGRLIRSASDRGVVAILDSRVKSKYYGSSFIHSVPRCSIKIGPTANLVPAAADWLRQ